MNLNKLNTIIIGCQACKLHQSRKNAIPGEGSIESRILFIGQSPGEREDALNRLFVGPSGKIFNHLLEETEIPREQVYITNLIKCMLPNARRPSKEELEICPQYLIKEIDLVHPKIIIPLGFHATRVIFREYGICFPSKKEVHNLFGVEIEIKNLIIYPVRHPTALLFNPKKEALMVRNYKGIKILADRYDLLEY